jgi:hypothetical protein
MTKHLVPLLFAACAFATPFASAQTAPAAANTLDQVRDAARADKRAYVAGVLKLTGEEAKRFWPIYDNYQRSVETNTRRLTRMVEDVVAVDNRTTDAYSKKIADELLLSVEDEARDWRRMHKSVMRALPASKAVRYLQIENKLRAVRDYEHAQALPILK